MVLVWLQLMCFSFRDEMEKMKIPKDMEDAKALGTVLSKYKDTYYSQVLLAYFTTYVLYPYRTAKWAHDLSQPSRTAKRAHDLSQPIRTAKSLPDPTQLYSTQG